MYRGAKISSDHFLIKAKIRQVVPILTKRKKEKGERMNVEALKSEKVRECYEELINQRLNNENREREVSMTDRWEVIIETIKQGTQILPSTKKGRNWFDQNCRDVVKEKRKARMKMLKKDTEATQRVYKKVTRKAKEICRAKKKADLHTKIEKLKEKHQKKK
ncbi:hypothetical protein RN001_014491 [Aquatica leii]|uniref:Uncharacterized protein n=1 Tax=Aquatica leii TaxID=1421715 RepID=A0AAN7SBG7_9COLE|nr:hypothetical protein RN001_014491 [Aquatica leii]